jgi:hypothetical protein
MTTVNESGGAEFLSGIGPEPLPLLDAAYYYK